MRRLRFTWHRRLPGIQKNSAWSALVLKASKSASRSSSDSIVSQACRLNAGTHWIVTAVTMPERTDADAPDTQEVGVDRLVAPHDLAPAVDELDRHDRRGDVAQSRPVPWVAVLIAPATDWTLMSPRLGIANPTDVELIGEGPQRDPGLDRHAPTLTVDVAHRAHPLERQRARPTSSPPG